MTSHKSAGPKKRLNLDLIRSDRQRLDDLRCWTDHSYAEVVRWLIRAFHEIGKMLRDGGKLYIHHKDGTVAEFVLFIEEDRRAEGVSPDANLD